MPQLWLLLLLSPVLIKFVPSPKLNLRVRCSIYSNSSNSLYNWKSKFKFLLINNKVFEETVILHHKQLYCEGIKIFKLGPYKQLFDIIIVPYWIINNKNINVLGWILKWILTPQSHQIIDTYKTFFIGLVAKHSSNVKHVFCLISFFVKTLPKL